MAESCVQCGAPLAAADLACPTCHTLVYAAELKQLAAEADAHLAAGRPSEALASWRRVLERLPPESRQHAQVTEKVASISRSLDRPTAAQSGLDSPVAAAHSGTGSPAATSPAGPGSSGSSGSGGASGSSGAPQSALGRGAAAAGAFGLLLWKLKWVVVFVLGKGKLLLLGLTKTSTLFSMLLSFGVYWTVFGWKFAIGLVLSIYVHEMGHVYAMHRLGFRASAPMFIPGLGAFVRLKQRPVEAREDARIGLAGPIWGAVAALACFGLFHLTDWALLHALAKVGAWINLFNLLPAWTLDGGRAFNALSRRQRLICTAALGTAWFLTAETLLLLLAIAAGLRAAGHGRAQGESSRPSPSPDGVRKGDRRACVEYVVLVGILSALAAI